MEYEESNESTEFAEKTSTTKRAPHKDDKTRMAEMSDEAINMKDLLEYDEEKDSGLRDAFASD